MIKISRTDILQKEQLGALFKFGSTYSFLKEILWMLFESVS